MEHSYDKQYFHIVNTPLLSIKLLPKVNDKLFFVSNKGVVLCVWVPVTTALRVLRLRMEEQPPIWRVAANKLNKQSRTADKGWSSSLGVG